MTTERPDHEARQRAIDLIQIRAGDIIEGDVIQVPHSGDFWWEVAGTVHLDDTRHLHPWLAVPVKNATSIGLLLFRHDEQLAEVAGCIHEALETTDVHDPAQRDGAIARVRDVVANAARRGDVVALNPYQPVTVQVPADDDHDLSSRVQDLEIASIKADETLSEIADNVKDVDRRVEDLSGRLDDHDREIAELR